MKLIIEFPPFGGLYEGHTILENLYCQKYQIVMAGPKFSK